MYSPVILKTNSPYILKDYYLVEQNDGVWLLARGFAYSFQSWVESCKRKRWDEIEQQFRSIFSVISIVSRLTYFLINSQPTSFIWSSIQLIMLGKFHFSTRENLFTRYCFKTRCSRILGSHLACS